MRIYGRGQRLPVLSGSRLKAPRGPSFPSGCTSMASVKEQDTNDPNQIISSSAARRAAHTDNVAKKL